VVVDWCVVPSAVRTERVGALWFTCKRGTLGLRKWLLAPESKMAVVWLGVRVGIGLAVKTNFCGVVNALLNLVGLVVPNCHSDL